MHTVQARRRGGAIRPEPFQGVARLFFSAADPVRIKILMRLAAQREACVSDLADELGMSLPAISHHLRILQQCRCVKTVRTGRLVCYQFIQNAFTKLVLGYLRNVRAV